MTNIFFCTLFAIVILFKNGVHSQSCGVSKIGRGNIIGGSYVKHGQFPWFAAIMKIDQKGDHKYICGGTLISNKLVLTVAHCMLNKGEHKPLLIREVLIILGSYNMDLKYEVGREVKYPARIHIHPDWSPHLIKFDADLAILEIETPVVFSNYIQPICMWESLYDPPASSGVVVGYGKSETNPKEHENIPKVLNLPIHTQEDCFLNSPGLISLASKRTLCAGVGDGTGVCLGDSGGGLMIQSNDAFYLRGIVSSSLISDFSCDVKNYAIFTNVLKFKDWIKRFIVEERIGDVFEVKQKDSECGIMSSSSGLIQKGKFSSRKEFPWMASIVDHVVAIIVNSSGALISHKHVVTRGRVVSYWKKDQFKLIPVELSRLKIYLGSLQHVSTQRGINAQEIILHPNIKQVEEIEIYDIAIIILATSVEFNDFIRPVCLWTFSSDMDLIKNLPIYAVGYGRDENGVVTNVRKHTKVTLVDQNVCKEKHKEVPTVLREMKTFCIVGSENGSPCEFDECLFIKYDEKWYLRGILSRRYFYKNRSCSFDLPHLYQDTSQHLQWVQSQVGK